MHPSKHPVLYIDDEQSNLLVFELEFRELFEVHLAVSAEEAFGLLQKISIPVVIADQRIPEMSGVGVFQILKQRLPHTQQVILSRLTEPDELIDAFNTGTIFNFVRKPWERTELLAVIQRALEAHDLSLQNSILTEKLVLAER